MTVYLIWRVFGCRVSLGNVLDEKKAEILSRWIDRVVASYPAEAERFFKNRPDQFANPVGHTIAAVLGRIYDALEGNRQIDTLLPDLEHFVKIRAVQSFTPSEAVAFVYVLKGAVRDACRQASGPAPNLEEWFAFEEKIDALAYTVFDLYVGCRERLYQTRIKELKSGNHFMTQGVCPSAAMKRRQGEQSDPASHGGTDGLQAVTP